MSVLLANVLLFAFVSRYAAVLESELTVELEIVLLELPPSQMA